MKSLKHYIVKSLKMCILQMKNFYSKIIIFVLLFIFFQQNKSFSQEKIDKKISIAILKFTNTDSYTYDYTPEQKQKEIQILQDRLTSVFSDDLRFILVDRGKTALIEKERELQKKEDFIDGYVTKQGTAIGADYLITGLHDFKTKTLSINFYEVGSGKLLGNEIFKDRISDFGTPLNKQITKQLVQKYFPLSPLKIIRFLTENDKKDEVLIAGGKKNGLNTKETLWVMEQILETFEGKEVLRDVKIGELKILYVENDNFSVCKITKGSQKIKERINQNIKPYCVRPKN